MSDLIVCQKHPNTELRSEKTKKIHNCWKTLTPVRRCADRTPPNTLSEELIQKFSLFNAAMTKSYFLLLVSLLFLLAWNASYRFKNRLYETFGVTGSAKLINCGVLFLLLCILFVMGDTIALLTENFSASVWVTSGYLLLWVFLVWWIARQLVSARIQWKSHRSTNAIDVEHTTDSSWKEDQFQQLEKEFQGLFEGERDWGQ